MTSSAPSRPPPAVLRSGEASAGGDRKVFGRRVPMTPLIDALPIPAPAETFTVPVEMVLYQANATSLMFLHRARRMGATFRPRASVWRVGERLLARVDFLIPVGAENWCEQVCQLSTHLWESLG